MGGSKNRILECVIKGNWYGQFDFEGVFLEGISANWDRFSFPAKVNSF